LKVRNDARKESQYVATLLEPLIANSCEEFNDPDIARNISLSFAAAFGVEKQLAAQKHVNFLLSCPPIEKRLSGDIRFDLFQCEKAVRTSLNQKFILDETRCSTRKALVGLEGDIGFVTDYERHSLLLSLYHQELTAVVESEPIRRKINLTIPPRSSSPSSNTEMRSIY
jgi:hypothetical protein